MTRPSVAVPTGIEIGAPVSIACMPRRMPSVALHRDRADAVLAQVLLDLGDDVDRLPALGPGDPDRVVDVRQMSALELDVDDRSDDLDDLADLLIRCCCCGHIYLFLEAASFRLPAPSFPYSLFNAAGPHPRGYPRFASLAPG